MRYVIDASASKLTVRVYASGMLSSLGHNPVFAVRKFEGELELNEQPSGSAQAHAGLDLARASGRRQRTGSVGHHAHHAGRRPGGRCLPDDHVRGIPGRTTVKPAGANQYESASTGELTLHGTTRTHPINARVLIHGDMLRASGEVPIQQPDYKLKPVKVPGSMMKVKDEVKLTFDIVARK